MSGCISQNLAVVEAAPQRETRSLQNLPDEIWSEILVRSDIATVMQVRASTPTMRGIVDRLPQNHLDQINIHDQEANNLLYRSGQEEAIILRDRDLFNAVQNNDADLVSAIIRSGVNINQADNDGVTALMLASENGHEATVEALLGAGAD